MVRPRAGLGRAGNSLTSLEQSLAPALRSSLVSECPRVSWEILGASLASSRPRGNGHLLGTTDSPCWPPAETLRHLASRRRGAGVTEEDPPKIDDRMSAVSGLLALPEAASSSESANFWPFSVFFLPSLSEPIPAGRILLALWSGADLEFQRGSRNSNSMDMVRGLQIGMHAFCRWVSTVHQRFERVAAHVHISHPPGEWEQPSSFLSAQDSTCHRPKHPWI